MFAIFLSAVTFFLSAVMFFLPAVTFFLPALKRQGQFYIVYSIIFTRCYASLSNIMPAAGKCLEFYAGLKRLV